MLVSRVLGTKAQGSGGFAEVIVDGVRVCHRAGAGAGPDQSVSPGHGNVSPGEGDVTTGFTKSQTTYVDYCRPDVHRASSQAIRVGAKIHDVTGCSRD